MEWEDLKGIEKETASCKFHALINASNDDFSDLAREVNEELEPEDITEYSKLFYAISDNYNKRIIMHGIATVHSTESERFLISVAKSDENDMVRYNAIKHLIDRENSDWIPDSRTELQSDFYQSLLAYKNYRDGSISREELHELTHSKLISGADYWYRIYRLTRLDVYLYDKIVFCLDLEELQCEKRSAVRSGAYRRAEQITVIQKKMLRKKKKEEMSSIVGSLKSDEKVSTSKQKSKSIYQHLVSCPENRMYRAILSLENSLAPEDISEFAKCFFANISTVNQWQIMFAILKIKGPETNSFLMSVAKSKVNRSLRHCAIEYLIENRVSGWLPISKRLLSTDFYKSLLLYQQFVETNMRIGELRAHSLLNMKRENDYWHNLARYADFYEFYGYN